MVKDKISEPQLSASPTDVNLQKDLGADEVSAPSSSEVEPVPGPSSTSNDVECRIPPVIFKKGGRTVVVPMTSTWSANSPGIHLMMKIFSLKSPKICWILF